MAAAFFQGTLGQFASYSSFGNVGSQLRGEGSAGNCAGAAGCYGRRWIESNTDD
jgi:type IV secretion system protein VirB6